MSARPQVLCWLMCDAVHIDPATGKHYILGTFSNIRSRQFPMKHPRMIWFLSLSDVGVGKHVLRISMGEPLEPPRPVLQREFESRSPLHRINLINEIQGMVFSKPGDFAITVEIDDEPILVTTLSVSGLPGQSPVEE